MFDFFKKKSNTKIDEFPKDNNFSCVHVYGKTKYPQYIIGVRSYNSLSEVKPIISLDGVSIEIVRKYLDNLSTSCRDEEYYLKIIEKDQDFENCIWAPIAVPYVLDPLPENASMADIISKINYIIDKINSP